MIDYEKIVAAERYWRGKGFDRTTVPWLVPQAISNVTKPPDRENFATKWGDPVASGEQSFLYLMSQCLLPEPRRRGWYCITPCFRWEPQYDTYHLPYFLKLELIEFDCEPGADYNLASVAAKFFDSYLPVELEKTPEGWDVVTRKNKIELGSYGIRRWKEFEWLYGTGCAEPRLSTTIREND